MRKRSKITLVTIILASVLIILNFQLADKFSEIKKQNEIGSENNETEEIKEGSERELEELKAKIRDSDRIADLRQMQNGLEIFYSEHGYYPRDAYSEIKQQLPTDPQGGRYRYIQKSPQSYIVGTCLEVNKSADIVEGIETNDRVGPIGSPLSPKPSCRCDDVNGYCVGIDLKIVD